MSPLVLSSNLKGSLKGSMNGEKRNKKQSAPKETTRKRVTSATTNQFYARGKIVSFWGKTGAGRTISQSVGNIPWSSAAARCLSYDFFHPLFSHLTSPPFLSSSLQFDPSDHLKVQWKASSVLHSFSRLWYAESWENILLSSQILTTVSKYQSFTL